MFNTVTQHPERAPLARFGTVVLSALAHVAVIVVLIVSTLFVTGTLPAPPDMMVFVAAAPAPPPPPAPPAPPLPAKATPRVATARPAPIVTTPHVAAPVEAPAVIAAETGREAEVFAPVAGFETSSSNGVIGGIDGGLDLAPPPPPPAPPAAPIRVGGAIKAPKLIRRVEPDYPAMAAQAQMEGMVILEAMVDEAGNVDGVKVLRSRSIFDDAAIASVKQWRYEPLMMNGQATPFVLTVTLSFSMTR